MSKKKGKSTVKGNKEREKTTKKNRVKNVCGWGRSKEEKIFRVEIKCELIK